jgi:hypothetical protein
MWSGRTSRKAQSLTREPVVDQIHMSEQVGSDQDHEKDMDARCNTQVGNVADACQSMNDARTLFAQLLIRIVRVINGNLPTAPSMRRSFNLSATTAYNPFPIHLPQAASRSNCNSGINEPAEPLALRHFY